MSSLRVKIVRLIALDRDKTEYGVLLILIESIHINLQNNALSFRRLIAYELATICINFVGLNTRELANQDNSRSRLIERN